MEKMFLDMEKEVKHEAGCIHQHRWLSYTALLVTCTDPRPPDVSENKLD